MRLSRPFVSRFVIAGLLAISGSIIGGALAPVPLEASRPRCENDACSDGMLWDSCYPGMGITGTGCNMVSTYACDTYLCE